MVTYLLPFIQQRRLLTWMVACALLGCSGDPVGSPGGAGSGPTPTPTTGGAGVASGAAGSTGEGGAPPASGGGEVGGDGGAGSSGTDSTDAGGGGAGGSTAAGGSVAGGNRAADARADTGGGAAGIRPSDAGRPDDAKAEAGPLITPRPDGPVAKFTVYLAGDSTVSQYTLDPANPKSWAGWGQMLQPSYDAGTVTVLDKAVGGMTARHFILGGNLAAILTVLKAGDYLLVQFGTNDSNTSAMFTIGAMSYPYFADANTDFKTYLQQYIDGAIAKGATPVLVTPPPRNSAYCGGGRSLANYGQAMIELGAAQKVAVVDLGLKTWAYLNKICPKPASGATEAFFKVTGTVIDGTHFQENGARIMAGFVADGVGEAGLGLNAFRVK